MKRTEEPISFQIFNFVLNTLHTNMAASKWQRVRLNKNINITGWKENQKWRRRNQFQWLGAFHTFDDLNFGDRGGETGLAISASREVAIIPGT